MVSLLQVILVLSISAIPLFHVHHEEVHLNKTDASAFSQAIEKCQICDFLARNQQKEFLKPSQQRMHLVLSFPLAKQVPGTITFYTFTLPGFTNKGPPSIFAFS
ncbi:hypothetical protein [Pedobacter psychroterrae]|nr:hypothetical protein [Pedobacter psychroterrae]